MGKEPSNANNRAVFIPKNGGYAYTGAVDGCHALTAVLDQDVIEFETAEEADKHCTKVNAERLG